MPSPRGVSGAERATKPLLAGGLMLTEEDEDEPTLAAPLPLTLPATLLLEGTVAGLRRAKPSWWRLWSEVALAASEPLPPVLPSAARVDRALPVGEGTGARPKGSQMDDDDAEAEAEEPPSRPWPSPATDSGEGKGPPTLLPPPSLAAVLVRPPPTRLAPALPLASTVALPLLPPRPAGEGRGKPL